MTHTAPPPGVGEGEAQRLLQGFRKVGQDWAWLQHQSELPPQHHSVGDQKKFDSSNTGNKLITTFSLHEREYCT